MPMVVIGTTTVQNGGSGSELGGHTCAPTRILAETAD